VSIEEDFPVGTQVRRKKSNTNNPQYAVGSQPFEVFGHRKTEYGEYVSDEYSQWHSPDMIEKVPEPGSTYPVDLGPLSKVAYIGLTEVREKEKEAAAEETFTGGRYNHGTVPLDPGAFAAAEEFAANTVKFLNAEIQNHVDPEHYKFGTAQVIDITRHLPFPEGNVIKYVARAGRKGDRLQDLYKAKQYLDWAIEDAEAEK
jgi:hypothetical protein